MGSGEAAFLAWLRSSDPAPPQELVVPIGDDGAVWRLDSGEELVLVADAVVEGSHFGPEASPAAVGRKALAVNLSDLAAMGARPLCALVTCALPRHFPMDVARGLTAGLRELGEAWGCPLVGGDTVTHDGGLVLSVTALGLPVGAGAVRRSGARAGDLIAVTGRIGGSGRGRHLTFVPRLAEAAALVRGGPPTAMIDVSDGLLIDLWRVADASGLGFRLEADRVPLHDDVGPGPGARRRALGEGEDFELLFTAPRATMERLRGGWSLGTPFTVVGSMVGDPRDRVLVVGGEARPARPEGHEHR